MRIKTTKRHLCPPDGKAVIKNQTAPSTGEDVEKLEPPRTAGGNLKWYCYFEKHFGLFSTGSMEGAPGKKEVPSVPEILKKKRRDFMELKIKHRRKMFA